MRRDTVRLERAEITMRPVELSAFVRAFIGEQMRIEEHANGITERWRELDRMFNNATPRTVEAMVLAAESFR